MATLKTWVDIGLKGNLQEQSRKNAEAMERFGQRSKGALAGVGAGLENWAKSLGAVAAGYLSINSAMQLATKIGDLEERIVRLKQASKLSKEGMAELHAAIRAIASDPNISIDDTKLLEAVEKYIADRGYDEILKANLKNIAIFQQVSGGAGKDTGGMVSQAPKLGITSPEDMATFLDTWREQGMFAAMTAQDSARFAAQIFTTAVASNMKGLKGAREAGALLQVTMAAKGDPEQARTSFISFFADMKKNGDKLKKLGIEIYDPEKLKEGKEELRSIPELLQEIMQKTGGRGSILQDIFGEQSIGLIQLLQSKEGWELFQNLLKIQSSGENMTKDAEELAQTANAKKARAANIGMEVADERGRGFVDDLSDAQMQITEGLAEWQKGKSLTGMAYHGIVDLPVWMAKTMGQAALENYLRNIGRPFEKMTRGEWPYAPAAPAPSPAPAAPQAVDVNIKVDQTGKVKEVKVKGAGDGSAQIMRGARVPQ